MSETNLQSVVNNGPLLTSQPMRPAGVYKRVNKDLTDQFVNINGYTVGQQRVLGATIDEVEIEIDLETYERMENDSTISKSKKILITSVLSDDLQLAPGATEDEVSSREYKTFVDVMQFCQRVIGGLNKPYRKTLEMLLGNGLRYGHGIGEVQWEYRLDGPLEQASRTRTPQKSKLSAFWSNWSFRSAAKDDDEETVARRPALRGQKTRLMPRSIKVKPRGRALFVVDDFMEVLGFVPSWNTTRSSLGWDEIIDRDKFIWFTVNEQDEDPRGKSTYRAAFNWFNLKAQVPAEMLRFILQESVPQAVGTLPPDAPAFEFERDEQNNIVYEDPETKQVPKMKTAAESMGDQIKGFRSGSGAVIPYGATLQPFKRNGSSDADIFPKIIKTINDEIENAILLQTLAQSEGSHQARSAAQQVAELLYALVFWLRWGLAMMTLEMCETAVRLNLGGWALKYMPQISLGDFVRRDWGDDLEKLADAYFKGFIDDTQRAPIMAWMNLPKPGPSRMEMAQLDPTTGTPVKPNQQRPDNQPGQDKRNDGNSKEKKNAERNENLGYGPLDSLGHHGRRFARSARTTFHGFE